MDTPEVLIAKCEESPANFRRLAAAYQALVVDLPSYRLPGGALVAIRAAAASWPPVAPHLVRMPLAPIYTRLLALRLYWALLNNGPRLQSRSLLMGTRANISAVANGRRMFSCYSKTAITSG